MTGPPISRTVGVEEELLLLYAGSLLPAAVGTTLLRDQGGPDGDLHGEFKQEQIEIASRATRSIGALERQLRRLRAGAAGTAARRDLRVVAAGTYPGTVSPTPMPGARNERIAAEFAELAIGQLTCGTHVHIGVASREEGVAILDRIRPWLAVLTALSANSPFWQGRDTGYASYRSIVLSQLPTSGPSPIWGETAAYDRIVREVITTGAAFDEGMVYLDARLSAKYPTVEVRVPDVTPDPADAALLAALCRGLVDTAVDEVRRGLAPPDVSVMTLRGAAWRAARHGMTDDLYDPTDGGVRPAWAVTHRLLEHAKPALEAAGDGATVRAGLARLHTRGTGAELQRNAAATGDLCNVVRDLAVVPPVHHRETDAKTSRTT